MKQSTCSNVCRHSAKRIKTLLDKDKYILLSYALVEQAKNNHFPGTHKCDYIKFPQIIPQRDRLCIYEFEITKHKYKSLHEKSRLIPLSHSNGPLSVLHQGVATTQCCVSQKHPNHFFLFEGTNAHDILSGRHIQNGFREYLLASKQFKKMAHHAIPNAKKYQIAILKDENTKDNPYDGWPLNWMPVQTEERHFLMGHTIKHPSKP